MSEAQNLSGPQPHEEAPTTSDVHGEIAVTNDLPSEETLKQAGEILVFTPDGKSRPFRELFTGEGNKRVMVIFIRHFMCGVRVTRRGIYRWRSITTNLSLD